MGEWSDYFEDFPEENPANYDKSGRFNPNHSAEAERQRIASERLTQTVRPDPLKIANDKLTQALARRPVAPKPKKA